jgi:peptidoglycan/LPS O-acetylase OafA/YrhL
MRNRIPALDGLRAAACLAVIAHHLDVPQLTGGWLGVDIFFVLSGYLITGLLLDDRKHFGRIRLKSFYLHRFARLYPALLVAVAAHLALTAATSGRWLDAVIPAGLAATYSMDVGIAVFQTATVGALGHTWSLGVEEQFYLVWPILIIKLKKRTSLLLACALLSAVSLPLMAFDQGTTVFLPAGYYAPQARAWELLMGCAVAALAPRCPRRLRAAAAMSGAPILTATLLIAAPLGRSNAIVLTALCLAASASTALVLLSTQVPSPVTMLLGSRLMVWLGQRSYGMYLFHIPISAAVALLLPGSRSLHTAAVLSASIVTAAISFRWIETPVRKWAHKRPDPSPMAALASTS